MDSGRNVGTFSPVFAFFRVRGGCVLIAAGILLGVLTALIGMRQAPIPTALQSGSAVIPMWRVFAMGAGVLPALGLYSRLKDLEQVVTRSLRSAERRYLIAISITCCGTYIIIAATTLHPLLLAIIVRSIVGWLGLALASGRIFGWRLAWIIPVATSVVLNYWGIDGAGDGYAWWEFTARPYNDPLSLLLSTVLLGLGVLAYAGTPWRWKRLTTLYAINPR